MSARILDITFEEYCAIDAVNFTSLKALATSPLQYRYERDNERPDTNAYRLGRATHTAVLEPRRLLREYAVWDRKTKSGDKAAPRNGKAWEEFQAQHEGRTILTLSQHEHAHDMGEAVRANPAIRPILTDPTGRAEVSLVWTHERTGLPCKCRVDWLTDTGAYDLKTTRAVMPDQFCRAAARLKYHVQAAFYSAGIAAAMEARPFKLIAVQTQPPHDAAPFWIPAEAIELGEEEYEGWFDRLLECQARDEWPGIGEQELKLPRWVWGYDDNEDTSDIGLEA